MLVDHLKRIIRVTFNTTSPEEKKMNIFLLLDRFVHSIWRLYILSIYSIKEELLSTDYFFSFKRIFIIFSLIGFFTTIIIWNYLGLFVDEVFLYPVLNFLNIIKSNYNLKSPTFIVGNARSGTTWLHRLLALDKETFTAMRTWEMVFALSLSWKLLFHSIYLVDKRICNSCLLTLLLQTEHKIVYQNNDKSTYLHPVGLMEVEEDEWLMVYIGYSQLITLFFPLGMNYLGDVIAWHKGNDAKTVAMKQYVMQFYAYCVEKHVLYKQIVGRRSHSALYLSKNPAFTLRIPSLYAQFPDAKVVCLIRDPCESIPSMISYISQVGIKSYRTLSRRIVECSTLTNVTRIAELAFDYNYYNRFGMCLLALGLLILMQPLYSTSVLNTICIPLVRNLICDVFCNVS